MIPDILLRLDMEAWPGKPLVKERSASGKPPYCTISHYEVTSAIGRYCLAYMKCDLLCSAHLVRTLEDIVKGIMDWIVN